MATYWDIINRNDLTPEQKAQEIQAIGELERKQIDRENLGAKARIGLGATLQGVSALPVFNIPYIGTGLGGALFETGNAIMQGKNKEDIAKDAGTGFVVGETVGAIPYVGKVASKTKAGQAAGNQASKLFNYLTDTKVGQKVAEIAPKVEDVLMTDIKAFNPNKQTAYHGSPYDFAKFSNEAIGTGEGAQAHGMGHYAAKSKDVADKRYRERLVEDTFDNVEIYSKEFDETVKEPFDVAQYLFGVKNNPKAYQNALNRAQKRQNEILESLEYSKKMQEQDPYNYIPNTEYENKLREELGRVNTALMYLEDINNLDIKFNYKTPGQLYKLSIPKDDVMLREDLPLSQQPLKVQENLRRLAQDYKDVGFGDLLDSIGYDETGESFYRLYSRQAGNGANAARELNNYGIKGISYNGGIDGEARVIFNPDDIDIVRKYYNQPELFQKLTGQAPNTGAVASNLYEYLANSKANKNFEKELNLLYNNPTNIDPNTLKINIGGISDKAFDLGSQNGYNLTDFYHTIDNSSFNHFRNRHFGENEIDERLIPLNDIDIRNIPNVIYNPDSLEFLPATKRKKPRIKYSKLVDDGKQIYVEELQNKKKRLNTKTMWKEKN